MYRLSVMGSNARARPQILMVRQRQSEEGIPMKPLLKDRCKECTLVESP